MLPKHCYPHFKRRKSRSTLRLPMASRTCEAELNVVRFPARARLVLGERIRGVDSAATRGLTNSQRLLLVSAFLAGERGTVCSFGCRHTIWHSALSAPCFNARIALLHGDGLFCHRLPNQPLRFFTHGLLRHFPGSSYSAFLSLEALEARRFAVQPFQLFIRQEKTRA